jgi:dTDP-4-amino-4,6-dideoxygalactose transaminase
MNVPFVDLRAQNAQVKNEIMEMWEDIIDTAGFVGGKYVAQFEERFAQMCGTKHCIAVSSGTDALVVGLWSLNVLPGDEIIVPANTFIATVEAVQNLGAVPVLVDCKLGTWNIDPAQVQSKITDRTVGMIGVHLYGQPCDMQALRDVCNENNMWLMEDSAQGHLATFNGLTCGSMGNIAAFSFYPGKNLGATGEGGAITTDNDELAHRARMYINHGSSKKYHHVTFGMNARMSSVIAAGLCAKLGKISEWTDNRRAVAKRYMSEIDNELIKLPEVLEGTNPVWHLFVVHCEARDELIQYLNDKGISAGMHYPIPVHLQKQMNGLGYMPGDFPASEFNASNCVSLPMFESLTDEQVTYVITSLNDFRG